MSGVLEMFEEYCLLNDKDAQITLTDDFKDWTWFKMYAFTKKKIDLQKELQSWNNLLSKHDNNYEEFSDCLEHCFLPRTLFFIHCFLSFNFLVNFWNEADENDSMTWNVTRDKISLLYYFNDEI